MQVKIASEPWEFEQIHALNHQTFTGEIPQHPRSPSGRLVDRFHDDNVYVIGLDERRVAGMIAIRRRRPFSLDQRLPNLDEYLPVGRTLCELRLLAVEKRDRRGRLLPAILDYVWRYCLREGFDVALISGTTRQLKLYAHLGFVPFGPLVGTPEAPFQPMMLTLERFAPRVPELFRAARLEPRRGARPERSGGTANFLPGPTAVRAEVRRAFEAPAESHRSAAFEADFDAIRTALCGLVRARRVAILLGSGTSANDAIAAQLSLQDAPGLILTNGEFGDRLIDHARRFKLTFDVLRHPWGEPFDLDALARGLVRRRPAGLRPGEGAWLWFVHCETSTGVLNDLDAIKSICSDAGVTLCVDAISSIGNVPVDLDGVSLASGVSGKGLGSFPGLAPVFYQHDLRPAPDALPRYLDLGLYATARVPFTHSSNLVRALGAAIDCVDWPARFKAVDEASAWLRARLRLLGFSIVAPEDHAAPGVVTIALPRAAGSAAIGAELQKQGFLLSVNSQYLLERNWIQICLMGESSRAQLASVSNALFQLCSRVATGV
jgi:aspartate aminotransferase-like enzyme